MESFKDISERSGSQEKRDAFKKSQAFTQIPNWFLQSPLFKPYEKIVLAVIKSHDINKGKSFPSIKTIARESGCSTGSVKNATKVLKQFKILEVHPDPSKRSNVYKINFNVSRLETT